MSKAQRKALRSSHETSWPLTTCLSDLDPGAEVSQDTTSTIFGLPRELRDQIYGYVLDCTRLPLPHPPARPGSFLGNTIYIKDTLPRSSVFTLLHSCRHIRREALDLIRRNATNKHQNSELNVMVLGNAITPWWTHLPPLLDPATPINLTVHLRVFSHEGFLLPDGYPTQLATDFCELLLLLNNFLKSGPGFSKTQAGLDLSINKLTIRLSNLDKYTPSMFPNAVCETIRMCEALALRGDARRYVRHIRVCVESEYTPIPGHEGREWGFEVSGIPDEEAIQKGNEQLCRLGPAAEDFDDENSDDSFVHEQPFLIREL